MNLSPNIFQSKEGWNWWASYLKILLQEEVKEIIKKFLVTLNVFNFYSSLLCILETIMSKLGEVECLSIHFYLYTFVKKIISELFCFQQTEVCDYLSEMHSEEFLQLGNCIKLLFLKGSFLTEDFNILCFFSLKNNSSRKKKFLYGDQWCDYLFIHYCI